MLRRPTLLAASLLLAGCSAMIPKPPQYTGADTVDTVPQNAFIGSWNMVALNPVDDEEVPERTISYTDDGRFTAEIMPTAEMAEAMGSEPIVMNGEWSVEGGALVHGTTELTLPNDDPMSRLIGAMMKSRPPIMARADVYELSAQRIVIVSEDGYANAFERL